MIPFLDPVTVTPDGDVQSARAAVAVTGASR